MFIRFDVIHERDRWTDRRTPGESKDRAYASHRVVKICIKIKNLDEICNVIQTENEIMDDIARSLTIQRRCVLTGNGENSLGK